jgi:uncharacterized protein (TIGR03083 family)
MGTDFLAHVRDDASAMARAARRGPLEAPVDGCPGWNVERLVAHLGRVHRWAALAARTGQPADREAVERPPTGPDVVPWYEAGIEPLLEALAHAVPGGWNFLGAPNEDGIFWPRRQAVETAIHRWDAEGAVGTTDPLAADVAVSGIDEMLDLIAPARFAQKGGELPSSLHLHCTDVEGEWTVRVDNSRVVVERGHAKGDAALRGPASSLLLAVWRRIGPNDTGLQTFGDESVVADWLDLF